MITPDERVFILDEFRKLYRRTGLDPSLVDKVVSLAADETLEASLGDCPTVAAALEARRAGVRPEAVKQPDELLAMGGTFYTIGEEAWCDTAADSWRLVSGKGYVRQTEEGG